MAELSELFETIFRSHGIEGSHVKKNVLDSEVQNMLYRRWSRKQELFSRGKKGGKIMRPELLGDKECIQRSIASMFPNQSCKIRFARLSMI